MIVAIPAHLIREGIRRSPLACPIALAMTEAGFQSVVVSRNYITYRRGRDETVRLSMDQPLYAWTLDFDRTEQTPDEPAPRRLKVDPHSQTASILQEQQ